MQIRLGCLPLISAAEYAALDGKKLLVANKTRSWLRNPNLPKQLAV